MDLISAAERLAAIDRSAVTLDQAGCLHSWDKFSDCELCYRVCPLQAIQEGKPPALDAEKCNTCLACLPVCPAGAFSAGDALPALLNCVARADAGTIELVCELHPAAEIGIPEFDLAIRTRGCLAGLGPGAYLALISLGCKRVVARTDACDECPFGSLKQRIEANITAARRLLEPWGWAGRLSTMLDEEFGAERPLWEAENPPLSRRDLFRLASRQSQVAAARVLAKDEQVAGRRPPRERRRVISALQHLPNPESSAYPTQAGMGFAMVAVSPECSACKACARACPTGCLKVIQSEEDRFALEFTPRACIGCEICVHVCAPQAVTIDQQPSFDQVFGNKGPVILFEAEIVRCERCSATFFSGEGSRLCPPCEFRRQNPFGSRLPPGIAATKRG